MLRFYNLGFGWFEKGAWTVSVNISCRQGFAGQSQWRGLSEGAISRAREYAARAKRLPLPPADKASAWRQEILTPQMRSHSKVMSV